MRPIETLRSETPGTSHVTHFNNAGAGLMPQPVIDAIQSHITLEATIGGYEAAAQATDKLQRTYDATAQLINAKPSEIAILENATRAWTMAFYGIQFQDGDRILTSVAEYASNMIAFLQIKKRVDISIEIVPNDEHGQLDVAALRQIADERVRLIAISHIPSQGGLIQPAAETGKIARDVNALYLLDACQSTGQIKVDVGEIGCHMLSATGRKYLRGPRGSGFLYISEEILDQIEPPLLDLHSAQWVAPDRYRLAEGATRFENWEMNIAAKIGLGVAIDYALELGIEAIEARIKDLAATFRAQLSSIDNVTVHDLGQHKGGIVTFTVNGIPSPEISASLREHQINTSVSPENYAINDLVARQTGSLVRASVHYYNTRKEIDRFCEVLQQIIS